MTVMQITRIRHPGRGARNINDFYYRGYETDDNGLRDVAAEMIESGEIVNRYLALDQDGERLTIVTIFKDRPAYLKWENHPVLKEARKMWEGREWYGGNEDTFCKEFVDVRQWKEKD